MQPYTHRYFVLNPRLRAPNSNLVPGSQEVPGIFGFSRRSNVSRMRVLPLSWSVGIIRRRLILRAQFEFVPFDYFPRNTYVLFSSNQVKKNHICDSSLSVLERIL